MNSEPKSDALLRDQLAIERTLLANERTLLAYIRTSLLLLASAFTLMKLYGDSVPLKFLGAGLIFLGILLIGWSVFHYRRIRCRVVRNCRDIKWIS